MTKTPNFQTNSFRIRGFEFSPILDLFGRLFVSDFEIRISDLSFWGLFLSAGLLSIFGFRILFRWRPFDSAQDMLGGRKFLGVFLLNISNSKI
jgi:hypothetical protein